MMVVCVLAAPMVVRAGEADGLHEQQPLTRDRRRHLIQSSLREGKAQFAKREDDRARRSFSQVLQLEPGHREARAYLERMAKRSARGGAAPAHEQETGRRPARAPRRAQPMPPTAGAYVGRRLAASETPHGSPNFARTAAPDAGASSAADREAARLQAREGAMERALQRQARRRPSDGRASR